MRYQPGFWEMIKYGWVQYLAIFFVVKYGLWTLEVRHASPRSSARGQEPARLAVSSAFSPCCAGGCGEPHSC